LLQANLLHLISTIAIFSAATIPIYISIKIKTGNKKKVRAITLTLTAFILIHGVYHVFALFGYTLIAEGVFEPLSAIILVLFAILMMRILYPDSLAILRKHK
jgi:peptidoglycan biosynthesis protein MviN/MurJ (putative lipid II flippase)